MTNVLYLIRGVPGSGKSTLAYLMSLNNPNVTPVSADDYMIDKDGNYKFDGDRLLEVHEKCKEQVSDLMRMGQKTIVVHNTFIKYWEMTPYHHLAKKYDYVIIEVVCKGNFKSVHNVPQNTIDRMRRNFEDSCQFDPV